MLILWITDRKVNLQFYLCPFLTQLFRSWFTLTMSGDIMLSHPNQWCMVSYLADFVLHVRPWRCALQKLDSEITILLVSGLSGQKKRERKKNIWEEHRKINSGRIRAAGYWCWLKVHVQEFMPSILLGGGGGGDALYSNQQRRWIGHNSLEPFSRRTLYNNLLKQTKKKCGHNTELV